MNNIVKKILNHEGYPAIESMSRTRFYSELKVMLSQVLEWVNKEALCNLNKEEERGQGKSYTQDNGSHSKVICYVENNDSHDEILEPLCKALNNMKLGCPSLLKEFEQDYTDNDVKNATRY